MMGFKRTEVQKVVILTWLLNYWTFGSVLLWYTFAILWTIALIICVTTYDHDYWMLKGVFSPPAWPLVGHIFSVVTFKEQGGMCFKRIYDTYKNERFLGTHQFYQRTFVVRDPELIKRICVNDFQHFVDRGFFFNKDVDPLAGSVLFLRGNEWRRLRTKISPIFSPNKLRGMFPLIQTTANEFVLNIKRLLKDDGYVSENVGNSAVVDSEKLVGGYTADAIVPCAFGIKSSVMENEKDPFAVALNAFYEMSVYNIFEKTMRQFWPAFVLFFKMRIIPKKTHDFFYNIVTSVLRARESGLQEKRGDFIDMMMALRNDEKNNNKTLDSEDVEITDMVISANAFIIFLGGFETTSSTLSFLFLELAASPRVQEKMRTEIMEVLERHEGNISYEMLQELPYMEMVIQETLRLYPPFPSIQRMCTKNYTIPGTNTVIERGTIVLFPTLGIQRDEQYFEQADEFIPERWAEGNPPPPPGVYMPFGDGPRYCIARRNYSLCLMVSTVQSKNNGDHRVTHYPSPVAAVISPWEQLDMHRLIPKRDPQKRITMTGFFAIYERKRFAMIQMKCCLISVLQHISIMPAPRTNLLGELLVEPRTGPFTADPRSPLTLHPADSLVRLKLL